jgi:hypothetical protein
MAIPIVSFLLLAPLPILNSIQIMTEENASSAGILFPFYKDPKEANIEPLINAKKQNPDLHIRVILNPDSGVGSKRRADYVSAIKSLKHAGISVVGYVSTHYAKRSSKSLEAEMVRWKTWYNPDGLFFDEMSDEPDYYGNLTLFAKNIGFAFSIGNPGTNISLSSAECVDTIIVFENNYLPHLSDFTEWENPNKIGILCHSIEIYPEAYIEAARSRFSWIFITDAYLPNPWGNYPIHFSQLVDQLGHLRKKI